MQNLTTPRFFQTLIKGRLLPYWSFIGFVTTVSIAFILIAVSFFGAVLAIALSTVFGYFLFRNTLNTVQSVGPVYWISRDYVPTNTRFISGGFMHELDAPWRHGKGVQIALFKRTFQIGLCKRHTFDETSGVLAAVQGRFMDESAHEIGNW
jgi:hypothetical protein